jgi:hypothetical protein
MALFDFVYLRQRRTLMHGHMIRLIALDLVLRLGFQCMYDVAFEGYFRSNCLGYSAGYPAQLPNFTLHDPQP